MTIFQHSLSRFTWLSHSGLVYIHFSLSTNPPSTSLLSMWAHSAEPLNLPLFSHLCIGSPCLANAVVLSLANDFLPQEQAVGTKQEPPQRAWISQHRIKEKWRGFNLAVNLTFRAERIILHETDRNHKRLTRTTRCYLDGYLGLHVPQQWQGAEEVAKQKKQ